MQVGGNFINAFFFLQRSNLATIASSLKALLACFQYTCELKATDLVTSKSLIIVFKKMCLTCNIKKMCLTCNITEVQMCSNKIEHAEKCLFLLNSSR